MDVILGRYTINIGQDGLLLKHPLGIEFHLSADETLKLYTFLNAYRDALGSLLNLEHYNNHYLHNDFMDDEGSHINISHGVVRDQSEKKVVR